MGNNVSESETGFGQNETSNSDDDTIARLPIEEILGDNIRAECDLPPNLGSLIRPKPSTLGEVSLHKIGYHYNRPIDCLTTAAVYTDDKTHILKLFCFINASQPNTIHFRGRIAMNPNYPIDINDKSTMEQMCSNAFNICDNINVNHTNKSSCSSYHGNNDRIKALSLCDNGRYLAYMFECGHTYITQIDSTLNSDLDMISIELRNTIVVNVSPSNCAIVSVDRCKCRSKHKTVSNKYHWMKWLPKHHVLLMSNTAMENYWAVVHIKKPNETILSPLSVELNRLSFGDENSAEFCDLVQLSNHSQMYRILISSQNKATFYDALYIDDNTNLNGDILSITEIGAYDTFDTLKCVALAPSGNVCVIATEKEYSIIRMQPNHWDTNAKFRPIYTRDMTSIKHSFIQSAIFTDNNTLICARNTDGNLLCTRFVDTAALMDLFLAYFNHITALAHHLLSYLYGRDHFTTLTFELSASQSINKAFRCRKINSLQRCHWLHNIAPSKISNCNDFIFGFQRNESDIDDYSPKSSSDVCCIGFVITRCLPLSGLEHLLDNRQLFPIDFQRVTKSLRRSPSKWHKIFMKFGDSLLIDQVPKLIAVTFAIAVAGRNRTQITKFLPLVSKLVKPIAHWIVHNKMLERNRIAVDRSELETDFILWIEECRFDVELIDDLLWKYRQLTEKKKHKTVFEEMVEAQSSSNTF